MTNIKQKQWTYQEYCQLTDDKSYEIIEGELIEMPSPTPEHQIILNNLLTELNIHLRKNKLGRLIPSPIDVKFDEINTVQPDIVYIAKENESIIQKKAIIGSPDLLVEILSPNNPERDTESKFAVYQKHKVKEYWLVDPVSKSIEVYVLQHDKLVLYC